MKLAAFTAVCVILTLASICWVQHARIETMRVDLVRTQHELERIQELLPPGTQRTLGKSANRHKLRNELNQLREDVELIRKAKGTNSVEAVLAANRLKSSTANSSTQAHKPILEEPNVLVDRILQGDRSGLSGLSELSREAHSLLNTNKSTGFDPFLELRQAFIRLGQAAGAGDLQALNALWRATRDDYLSELAVAGLGEAAALGQEDAMEMLLNPTEFGLLESNTLNALATAAQNLNARAIEAMASFAYQPENSALWNITASGLEPAALAGNDVALEALVEIARPQAEGSETARLILERAALQNTPEAVEVLQAQPPAIEQTTPVTTNQNF
ncbi:MAG: hypothetical protein ACO1QB_08695 [Verrucomicrobiales bacterium]